MLNKNFNMANVSDVKELYARASPILRAILATVYEHNEISTKVGWLYKGTSNRFDARQPEIAERIRRRNLLRSKIRTACATIGYVAVEVQGRRISCLRPKGGKSRKAGDITYLNQKGLFIFSAGTGTEVKLQEIVISQIIEE